MIWAMSPEFTAGRVVAGLQGRGRFRSGFQARGWEKLESSLGDLSPEI